MALLEEVIKDFQELMRGMAGVRTAPNLPPDKAAASLTISCYPVAGTWTWNTPEDVRGLHNLGIAVHVPYKAGLPRAIEMTLPYGDLVPKTLAAALKNGNLPLIDTFATVTYTYGYFEWNQEPRFGWRFTVNEVKVRVNLS